MLFLARDIGKETVKDPRNIVALKEIMDILIKTQDQALDNECAELIKVSKTPESIKACSAVKFILSSERNQIVIRALMSISKISQSCLTDVPIKKLEKICLAYETILSARKYHLVTLPSLSKNLLLLKLTHHKALVNSVGYPAGGKYDTVQKLANKSLPELMPPPTGDFVSTDDNIQIKRVVATRDLKANFKFNVKVVNNHAFFQTLSDRSSAILKNSNLQPKYWMHKPTTLEVDQFEKVIKTYEQLAKKVRSNLLKKWLDDEANTFGDLVQRLNILRYTNQNNTWPCQRCHNTGDCG